MIRQKLFLVCGAHPTKLQEEIFVDDICKHLIDVTNVEFEKLLEGYFQSWTDFLDYIKR